MARSVFGRKNKGFSGFISFILLIVGVFLIVLIFQGIFGKTAKINGYVKTAKKYTLEGNYGGATEQLNKALQLDTTNPLIYDAMGFLNNAKGDTEQAKYFYQTAVEKGFKYNGRFDHKKIGNEYIAKGKYPQALAEFEHYTALKPADKNGLLGLALSLQALERVNESLEAYKKAAAISKSS